MSTLTINSTPAPATEFHGFYEDLPFQAYAAVDALNGSSIVHMRRSAVAYKHQKDNPPEQTDAMMMGTEVHRLILEPGRVKQYAIWGLAKTEKVRSGKVWEAFKKANADKHILTRSQAEAVFGMADSARKNEPIRRYADMGGLTEVSLFWRHPHTGRRFKARLDKVIPETHTIFDLKTTRDCHSYRFGGQAYALGYHIKMALYWFGYRELTGHEPTLKLGALDSKAPHEGAVYRVTRETVMQGLEELDLLVAKLDECEKSGKWPAEYDQETDLLLPKWAAAEQFGDGEYA